MRYIKYPIPFVAAALLCCSLNTEAAVTIEVLTSGYGNKTTDAVNGMAWGLVIDSGSGTFSASVTSILSSALLGFTPPPTATTTTPTQIGTSSLYFVRGQSDTSSGPPPSFVGGTINAARFSFTGPVDNGDALGLLWLPAGNSAVQTGDSFGFQDLSSTVPADGLTTNVAGSASPARANFTVIPEPSTALLGLLGIGALFLRRRR